MVTAVMPERLRKFSHGVSNEKEQDQKRSRTRHNLPDGDRHRAAVRRDVPSVWPTLDVQWPPKSRLSLETYLIGAAVLIGEAEGQLFTAYKLETCVLDKRIKPPQVGQGTSWSVLTAETRTALDSRARRSRGRCNDGKINTLYRGP